MIWGAELYEQQISCKDVPVVVKIWQWADPLSTRSVHQTFLMTPSAYQNPRLRNSCCETHLSVLTSVCSGASPNRKCVSFFACWEVQSSRFMMIRSPRVKMCVIDLHLSQVFLCVCVSVHAGVCVSVCYDRMFSVTVPLCFLRMATACSCVAPCRLSPFTDRIWSPRFRRPSTAAAPLLKTVLT